MSMNRRDFLKGLTATTAAGLLIPERKIWALDGTMVPAQTITIPGDRIGWTIAEYEAATYHYTIDDRSVVQWITLDEMRIPLRVYPDGFAFRESTRA